ncbi:MAG: arginase [Planctomycetota bacterium]
MSGVCEQLCDEVASALGEGGFPLVIGGDHSIAMGTLSGIARHVRDAKGGEEPRIGLLWFDAHADLNTPATSPTGNIHGMPLATLLGQGPPELCNIGFEGPKLQARNIVQIGLRDLDDGEKKLIRDRGIHAYTMADIDKKGMATVMEEAIATVSKDTDFVHVDFDIDVMDPQIAPGTGTRKIGGLTYREAHLALEMTASRCELGSFGLVEVNPILDERNRTAEVAVSLIASAMGERIL